MKYCLLHSFISYRIAGNFSGRNLLREKTLRDKTFANCEVLWLFIKVFSTKFGGMASFGGISEYFAKAFHQNLIFHQFTKAFSSIVSHYKNILTIFVLQISIGITFNRLPSPSA